MATTDTILDDLYVKLATLIATQQVDYVEGDVEVKAGQKIEQIMKAIKLLTDKPEAEISIIAFNYRVSEFGEHLTDFEL